MDLTDQLLSLNRGLAYCIVFHSDAKREELLRELSSREDAAIVAYDGGLIGNLNVWENLTLPVHYHASGMARSLSDKMQPIFGQCGIADAELKKLLRKMPDDLSLYEKRLAGFVRAMLVEPELMVYDRVFDGLASNDVARVALFDDQFHNFFPFRTSVLLSFNEYSNLLKPHWQTLHL